MSILGGIKKYIENKFLSGHQFESFYNEGIDFYNAQDYDGAIKSFNVALKQKDVKPQVYYNLALSYQCIEEYDKAILHYNRFLKSHPSDYDGLYNIALAYYMKGHFSKSIDFFGKCLEIRIDDETIRAVIFACIAKKDMKRAFVFANRILKVPETGKHFYYKIAKIIEDKNPFGEDFTLINKAIEMYLKLANEYSDEYAFDSYLSVSICYAKKGDWENSIGFCRRALEINSTSYEANNQMGLIYYCREDIENAVKYYEIAFKQNERDDYKIYPNLGYAYEKVGKIKEAIKIFKLFIAKFNLSPAKEEIEHHLQILKDSY